MRAVLPPVQHEEAALTLKMHFIGKINGLYIYKSGENFVYLKKPLYKIKAEAPLSAAEGFSGKTNAGIPRLPPPTPARNER